MQKEIDLKRFKKLKRISKGSFSLVYQIQEKKTGELYAAKIIDCDDDEDKCNEMINREVSILMYTNHPTIIKFIGYSKIDFQEENNVTIIMELAKNGSLREILKQIQQSDGPKNYTNTTRQIILVGIARGMKYLHDRNIIHRDIKPENILLDENFQPHITDFGLSKFYEVGHSYSQTKFGGTLPYEAPEILNKQKYDKKVDVYSFSILMFEILTDSVPYPELLSGDMPEFEFTNKVVKKGYRPKFLFPVKDSLRKLIEQCWLENPDNRPTFDEIFNKLANKTGDVGENFLLEDVDTDELNLYVEDVTEITDSTEKLLSKISVLEEDNRQLKNEIGKLKEKDKEQSKVNKTLEEDNRKLKSEIEKLKEKDKEQSKVNKTLEEDNRQLKNEIGKLKEKDKEQSKVNKSLEEDNRQLKSEIEKLKTENKKQSDTIKTLEEDIKQFKSKNPKLKSENTKQDTNEEKVHEGSKIKQIQVINETEKSEAKSNQTKTKEKQQAVAITVCGCGNYKQLGVENNNSYKYNNLPLELFINPPLNLPLDPSSLLSYSTYHQHTVVVTRSGSLLGIGHNWKGRISSSLKKAYISEFTEFSIKDKNGHQLTPISAVCCAYGTLYMFLKSSGNGRQLVFCNEGIYEGFPVFLDIGDGEPVSLFGGYDYAAAINDKGEIIIISVSDVRFVHDKPIAAISLPDGEKASSIACLDKLIVVLSSNGRVFSSSTENRSKTVEFSPVSELYGHEIVWVSGTNEHLLAVSKEGRIFGYRSYLFLHLGLGKEEIPVFKFTEISSLSGYEIRAAYAGCNHSLFQTREGKILSCGNNKYGQLLLSSDPNKENFCSLRETTITEGATFCIAGNCLSVVFVGGDPPPNTPNMPIQYHQ